VKKGSGGENKIDVILLIRKKKEEVPQGVLVLSHLMKRGGRGGEEQGKVALICSLEKPRNCKRVITKKSLTIKKRIEKLSEW